MPRSRNGCTTCKKRHRKCDETKPTCLACEENGLLCEGYALRLTWDVGVASRGFLRGATLPVSQTVTWRDEESVTRASGYGSDRERSSTAHLEFLAGTSNDIVSFGDTFSACDYHEFAPDPRNESSEEGQQIQGSSRRWPEPATDEDRKALFKEFIESTIFSLYSTSIHDTFKAHLQHFALRSESLYNILIAIHLYTTNPNKPPSLFYEFFNRALSLFREHLEVANQALGVELLHFGLFVCTIHLFQATPWTGYLGSLISIFKSQQERGSARLIPDEDYRFPVEALAVMDLPTFVRGRQTQTMGIWAQLRSEEEKTAVGRTSGVESVSGLPRSLLDIFADISDAAAETALVNWAGEKGNVPQCHLWEAYRLAGILMGRRFRRRNEVQAKQQRHANSASSEVLVFRLMAVLDALYESSRQPKHSHILAKNSMLYPCTAVRLEVAVLRTQPALVETLRRYGDLCAAYRQTPNEAKLSAILDEALARGDDDVDLDLCATKQGVEFSLF